MMLGARPPGRSIWTNRNSPIAFGRLPRADGGCDLRLSFYGQGFPYRAVEDPSAEAFFDDWLATVASELGASPWGRLRREPSAPRDIPAQWPSVSLSRWSRPFICGYASYHATSAETAADRLVGGPSSRSLRCSQASLQYLGADRGLARGRRCPSARDSRGAPAATAVRQAF